MKYTYLLLVPIVLSSCISIKADVTTSEPVNTTLSDLNRAEAEIRLVLEAQEIAWNNYDLETFMEGYWKSDDLKFYGSGGLTLGWNQTLANYKKNYPSKAESGTLSFTIRDIAQIEGNSYWVMGAFYLKREIGDASGPFIIIFKKINGQWKIIADMTC